MKRSLIVIATALALLYAIAYTLPVDPDERRPGTRLSGELAEDQDPDWSFIQGRQKVYIQTNTWYSIPHSVTTLAFVVDHQLYIPCGQCAGKRWPSNVASDPRVTIKAGGRLYPRTAVRISGEGERRRILGLSEGEPTPKLDLYRLDPPSTWIRREIEATPESQRATALLEHRE